MIYFLYTGNITFAPFTSDQRYEIPAEARVGDWNLARIPCPSAKSIYRLADKVTEFTHLRCLLAHRFQYDLQTLKEQARAYIHGNLADCDIVEEVFSGFSLSWVTPPLQLSENPHFRNAAFRRCCRYKCRDLSAR